MNELKSENNINDECVGPPLFMYDRCSRAVVLFTYMWYTCVCVCVSAGLKYYKGTVSANSFHTIQLSQQRMHKQNETKYYRIL